ncbi:hypothetical protein B0H11DRAFT_2231120 [Mycena galericulata]|nr:hypothetical protein B0H11DRAFT_2231120 [Mycena galericulata]
MIKDSQYSWKIVIQVAGSLAPAAVDKSLRESYERLALGSDTGLVNVLYCHAPDRMTPLEEQATGLNAQCKKGLLKQLRVSNFPPEMLERFLEICDRERVICTDPADEPTRKGIPHVEVYDG